MVGHIATAGSPALLPAVRKPPPSRDGISVRSAHVRGLTLDMAGAPMALSQRHGRGCFGRVARLAAGLRPWDCPLGPYRCLRDADASGFDTDASRADVSGVRRRTGLVRTAG